MDGTARRPRRGGSEATVPRARCVRVLRGIEACSPLASAALVALALTGCDLITGTTPEPTTIALRPGVLAFDALGESRVVTAEVRDQSGAVLEDVELQWSSSNPSVASVSQDGSVTSQAIGTSTVTAATGLLSGSATVSVNQLPAKLEVLDGDGQDAPAGSFLPGQLRVRVADRMDAPIRGVTVVFSVTEGGGTVSPRSVPTDADGIAATNWRLGVDPDEPQRASARVLAAARLSADFHAVATPSERERKEFHIEVEYLTSVSVTVREAFEEAVARWSEVIVEKLFPVRIQLQAGACDNDEAVTLDVDDLHLLVSVVPIDGPGGVLAEARPCVLRDDSRLPVAGLIRVDRDDVGSLAEQDRLGDVILHEIGHVLGIGTLWREFGLLQNPSLPSSPGADTHFPGQRAIAAFDAVGGEGYTEGEKVPVENERGGQGNRDSHWRLSVFEDELMVGFVTTSSSVLSGVTIASLADLGYAVDEDLAQPYVLPMARTAPLAAATPGEGSEPIPLLDDVVHGPMLVVDRWGRVVHTLHPPLEDSPVLPGGRER